MTLRDFLDMTAAVPAPALRRAMVAALAAEPIRTPEAARRFYGRVIDELAVADEVEAVRERRAS